MKCTVIDRIVVCSTAVSSQYSRQADRGGGKGVKREVTSGMKQYNKQYYYYE